MMKYLTLANYGVVNGNFEMDLSDGEIRYKSYVDARSAGFHARGDRPGGDRHGSREGPHEWSRQKCEGLL